MALAAAFTLTPAMLACFGDLLFWPSKASCQRLGRNRGTEGQIALATTAFWVKVADLVVGYPLRIWAICLLILVPLAVVGACARSNYSQLADLDPAWQSVIGADVVRSYFPLGELSPIVVLIENPTLDFRSQQGRTAIEEISRRLTAIGGVVETRSSTRPMGKPGGLAAGKISFEWLSSQVVHIAAEPRYVSVNPRQTADLNHITRFEIVLKTDPFSESSLQCSKTCERR